VLTSLRRCTHAVRRAPGGATWCVTTSAGRAMSNAQHTRGRTQAGHAAAREWLPSPHADHARARACTGADCTGQTRGARALAGCGTVSRFGWVPSIFSIFCTGLRLVRTVHLRFTHLGSGSAWFSPPPPTAPSRAFDFFHFLHRFTLGSHGSPPVRPLRVRFCLVFTSTTNGSFQSMLQYPWLALFTAMCRKKRGGSNVAIAL
jgi:hypothetical protein